MDGAQPGSHAHPRTREEGEDNDEAGTSQAGRQAGKTRGKGETRRARITGPEQDIVWTIGYGVRPCTKSETETSSRRVICKASIAS